MKIKIDGMMCGNCVKHVDKALRAVAGVAEVEVSLADKWAVVSGAGFTEADIRAAIDEAGYDVAGIE